MAIEFSQVINELAFIPENLIHSRDYKTGFNCIQNCSVKVLRRMPNNNQVKFAVQMLLFIHN